MKPAALTILILALVASVAAAPLDREQPEASISYIDSLRNEDGGYRVAAAAGPSQLSATMASLRALKYLGGRPRDSEGALRFVRSCLNRDVAGFADRPGGTPDARSTAMGVMALAELKALPQDEPKARLTGYFTQNARMLPDVYIAAAALDAAGWEAPAARDWIAAFAATRNPDGSYGSGLGDLASAVVTTLRLKGDLRERGALVSNLKAAQLPDGGFAAMGETSDLATTYRVTRAFLMLKEKPDLTRLRGFIARCRSADGGYGPAPGQPSSASTTYFAAILLHWAEGMEKG